MKRFIRENAALVLGVSLPLLLVAGLLAIHGIARLTGEPPAYPVAYASFAHYAGQHQWSFDIAEDGRLRIEYLRTDHRASSPLSDDGRVTIAVFDAASDHLRTFDVGAPEDPPDGERVVVSLPPALQGVRFDGSTTAPDGYRFERGGRRGGGLFAEIFGTGTRHDHRLVDGGVPYAVPEIGSTTIYDRFIGWVVDGL